MKTAMVFSRRRKIVINVKELPGIHFLLDREVFRTLRMDQHTNVGKDSPTDAGPSSFTHRSVSDERRNFSGIEERKAGERAGL
jgi:hypothetical protein